jgi:dTDP-4-dehydrorhamnose 3,5-epimerase
LAPAAEVKIIRCIRGEAWDVVVDLRPDSPTFGQWFGTELSAENRRMMYIPRGFANAALSLADDTELLYLVSEFYTPAEERGVRWNDPRFAIKWPDTPTQISDKDRSWPDFDPALHGIEKLRGIK